MDKVNREKSIFEHQKAEVQKLLGEALDHWSKWSFKNESGTDLRTMVAKITDALAELDNMEEGEAVDLDDYRCPKCGWAIGFRAAEPPHKGLTLNQICNCGHSLYTHPEGSDTGCIALDQSKGLMCECEKFTPAEEPPQVEAKWFPGKEPIPDGNIWDTDWDYVKRYPMYHMGNPEGFWVPLKRKHAEKPPTKQVDIFKKDGVTYYAEVPDKEEE
jgi:hypothetical protein